MTRRVSGPPTRHVPIFAAVIQRMPATGLRVVSSQARTLRAFVEGDTIRASAVIVATASALLILTGCASPAPAVAPTPAVSSPAASATPTAAPSSTADSAPTVSPTATTEPVPAAEPEPAPPTLPARPTLDQLHEAYVATGLPCDWALTENVVLGSMESGRCRDTENGINTFASQADLDALLQLNTDSIEPGIFLVGDFWVVGSEHPEDLITAQTGMGGDLWPADTSFFPAE